VPDQEKRRSVAGEDGERRSRELGCVARRGWLGRRHREGCYGGCAREVAGDARGRRLRGMREDGGKGRGEGLRGYIGRVHSYMGRKAQ
jgi:hypothetical protein